MGRSDPRTLEYVAQKLRDAGHGDAAEEVDALVPTPVDEDVALLRAVLAESVKDDDPALAEHLLRGRYDNTRRFLAALAVYRKHKEDPRHD